MPSSDKGVLRAPQWAPLSDRMGLELESRGDSVSSPVEAGIDCGIGKQKALRTKKVVRFMRATYFLEPVSFMR